MFRVAKLVAVFFFFFDSLIFISWSTPNSQSIVFFLYQQRFAISKVEPNNIFVGFIIELKATKYHNPREAE